MPISRLTSAASPDEMAAVLRRDGLVIIERLAPKALMDRAATELSPFLERAPYGTDTLSGSRTRRIGALVARSAACRELIAHPVMLATMRCVFAEAAGFQLALTQAIAIGPGEAAQPIHRDQWSYDFFPFPPGYAAQCSTIWALTDFTEDNGATRVIRGSHLHEDRLDYDQSYTVPAEMPRGSVLLFLANVYHGGGPNHSREVRVGININYSLSWLRQEENQYLSVPMEVARQLSDQMLRLIGYSRGVYALGYIGDLRDPLEAVRGEGYCPPGFGQIEAPDDPLRALRKPTPA